MSKQFRIAGDAGTLKPIIEALIFASEEPLPARTLVRLLAGDDIAGKQAQEEGAVAGAEEQMSLVPPESEAPSAAASEAEAGAEPDAASAVEPASIEPASVESASVEPASGEPAPSVESADNEADEAASAGSMEETAPVEEPASDAATSDDVTADEAVADGAVTGENGAPKEHAPAVSEGTETATAEIAGEPADAAPTTEEQATEASSDEPVVDESIADERSDEESAAGDSVEEPADDDAGKIQAERIDLAVATTSQLVATIDDIVDEGVTLGPDVADVNALVETPGAPSEETPESAMPEEMIPLEPIPAESSADMADGGEEVDGPADTDAPDVETTAAEMPGDEKSAEEPAAGEAVGGDDAATDEAMGSEEAGEEMAADGATDEPTDADLLATTDPMTLDAEPPADLLDAEGVEPEIAASDAVESDGAVPESMPPSGSEETGALLEAMERAEARVAGRPSTWGRTETIDQRFVRLLIEELNLDYDETGRAFRIVEVAGGFQFATTRDFGEYVALLSKEKQRRRLSPAALETLAIIAYRQPVSKPEVEAIRGVNCDQVLLNLMEKNLISITGRSEGVGRPLLYGTTDEFLRVFGINNVGDLPKLRELEELMEENVLSPERAEVITVDENSEVAEIEAKVGAAGHHEDQLTLGDLTAPAESSAEIAAEEPATDESGAEESGAEEPVDEESAPEDEAADATAEASDEAPADASGDESSEESSEETAGDEGDEN